MNNNVNLQVTMRHTFVLKMKTNSSVTLENYRPDTHTHLYAGMKDILSKPS